MVILTTPIGGSIPNAYSSVIDLAPTILGMVRHPAPTFRGRETVHIRERRNMIAFLILIVNGSSIHPRRLQVANV